MKIKTLNVVAAIGLFLFVAMVSGCGGGTSSTSSSNGGFDSGFAKDRQLSSFSNEEALQLCNEAQDFLANDLTGENVCKVVVVAYSSPNGPQPLSGDECNEVLNQCYEVADELEQESGIGELACSNNASSTRTCPASIDLFERCLNELTSDFNDLVARSDCYAIDPQIADELETFFDNGVPQSPACIELNAACPDIFVENDENERIIDRS